MNTINNPKRPKAKSNEPSTDEVQDPYRKARVLRTRDELFEQPTAIMNSLTQELQHLTEIVSQLENRSFSRIIIIGCGDSWSVGVGMRLTFEKLLGIPTEPMQALDYCLYFSQTTNENTMVIGLSSSGTTTAVLDGLKKAQALGAFTIGVSNSEGTPILTDFNTHILVRATRKGWPTQASTAAMALLTQFAILLAKKWNHSDVYELENLQSDLDRLPLQITDLLQVSEEPIKTLAYSWVKAKLILFCGAGSNLAAANFGSAKVKELCPIHSLVVQMEEFHHYRTIKQNDVFILVSPDQTVTQKALDTAEIAIYDGGQILVIAPRNENRFGLFAENVVFIPEINPLLSPIIYSIPLQLFAFHLAMAKFEFNLQ